MVFVAIEGFSGSGKTTICKYLTKLGWTVIQESASLVPKYVSLADRANTYSDYSLIGSVLMYSFLISRKRKGKLVADGYLLSDLAYSKLRYEKGLSKAYPNLEYFLINVLKDKVLRPDAYFVLKPSFRTIIKRQKLKNQREKNVNRYFMKRYYEVLFSYHETLGDKNVYLVGTDGPISEIKSQILKLVEKI